MHPIYLDHNATTPTDPIVLEAMLPFLQGAYGNPSSDHPIGHAAKEAVEAARESVARLIGASSQEIVFTSGGTEASHLALIGSTHAMRRKRPQRPLHLLSFSLEHPATLRPLDELRTRGDNVTLIPPDGNGVFRLDMVQEVGQDGTDLDLVSLMHAHNETGAMQPVEEMGRIAKKSRAIFHVDAAQSLGKCRVDVDQLGCDLLSIAGHKLYAPKGVGALYVRAGLMIDPVFPGAGQERGLRGGTPNVPGIVALGAACRLAAERLAGGESERLRDLRERLWERLRTEINGVARTSAAVETLPNTLHVRFPGVTGNAILAATPEIAASTGSACHAGSPEPPAAIVALGVPEAEALGSLRLSLGHANDAEAVDRAATALARGWKTAKGGNPDGTRR